MKTPVITDSRGNPLTRSGYAHGGYLAAGHSRSRSYLPGMVTDSKREYTSYVRTEMTRKARFMDKNVGLVRGMKKTLIDEAIGPGIYPLPATSDERWNEFVWGKLQEISKIADVSGRTTLWEAQRVRTGNKFVDGDYFTMHVLSANGWPQYQLIRSHNCGSFDVSEDGGWIDGVQVDSVTRPKAYRFRLSGDERYQTVKAASVVHSYMLDEGDEIRGKTALTHAIDNLNDILDTLILELGGVKENSRIARVIETESGEDEEDPSARFGGVAADVTEEALALKLEQVFGAEIQRLKKGEKMYSHDSNRPSPTFVGFIDWLGKSVTNGCGLPYEYAWNPNELKGPGVRFVLGKVKLAVEEWRRNEIQDTYPFYTFAVSALMDIGEIPYHPEWYKVEWIGGAPDITIDKGRDSMQDRENIKAALDSFKRYFARQGLWWKTELRQKASEAGYIDQLAKEFGITTDRIHLLLANGGQPPAEAEPAPDDDDESDEKTKPAPRKPSARRDPRAR